MNRRSSIVSYFLLSFIIVNIVNGTEIKDDNHIVNRVLRSTNNNINKKECKYEKEAWEECDPTTGLQRRATRLKANAKSLNVDCEPVKYITRSCKKACRFTKGEWSECVNGERTRIDILKTIPSSPNCEQTRKVVKKCKPVCRYTKSEWSECENGIRTKTLTLEDGKPGECEPNKIIRKECEKSSKRGKHKKQKGRKLNNNNNNNSNNSNINSNA